MHEPLRPVVVGEVFALETTAKEPMEGDLSLLSIPDLLQMICLGGYSRDIHLFDGQVQLGVIAVRHGRIERCFGFGAWGEHAFYKLVNLQRGHYKVNEAQDMAGSDATLTAYSWQELLMEAARQQDEAKHIAQSAAATGRVIAFPTPMPAVPAVPAVPVVKIPPLPAAMPPGSVAPSHRARRVSQTLELPGIGEADRFGPDISGPDISGPDISGPDISGPDISGLLEEATACYLRRDLARTEELLQQCLALRPGDRRVLQNLERVRRKKSP